MARDKQAVDLKANGNGGGPGNPAPPPIRNAPLHIKFDVRYGATILKKGTVVGEISSTTLNAHQLGKALAAGVLSIAPQNG